MHKYLRAIGYSQIDNNKKLQEMIKEVIHTGEYREYTKKENNSVYVEYRMQVAENIGITVRGEFEEDNLLIYSHYFPHLRGEAISSEEDITVERHAEKESYAGVCDDVKIGVSLIFYLQNAAAYLKYKNSGKLPVKGTSLTLSALSCQGTIMMAIIKNEADMMKLLKASEDRNRLIEAARKGDEEAIESLTLEDMDTYSTISRRIQDEDIFSLVDTFFMPFGIECDQYSVLGEILECNERINAKTGEKLYQMRLICNDLVFDLCINQQDLLGEPLVGRRFKGTVWMQGYINFPPEEE